MTETEGGMPYYEADNGFGIPVTFVDQGGAPLGGANSEWVYRDSASAKALFDYDVANSRRFYNGSVYGSDAPFLTATGGTANGITRTFGPNVFGTTLIQNGVNPIASATGWTAVQAGGVVASGGNLVQTNGAGSTGPAQIYQQLTGGVTGSCYEVKVTVVGSFNRQILLVNDSNTTQFIIATGLGAGSYTYYIPWFPGFTRLMLQGDNVTNGATVSWTDISIKECRAFAGLQPNGLTWVRRFVTPASIASDQVLGEWGGANENNRCRLVYKQSTGHLLFIESRSSNTVTTIDRLTLDIGALSPSTEYRVCITMQNGYWRVAINGGATIAGATADYPTYAMFYINTDSAGAAFTGTDKRTTVFANVATIDFVSGMSNPGNYLLAMGDSYVAGANGVGMAATARAAGKLVLSPTSLATGGTDDVGQLAALVASPGYKGYNIIWDDGRANTGYDSNLYLENQRTFMALIGHSRYIRVLPVAVPGDDATTRDKIIDTCDALKGIIPATNYVDPRDVLSNTGGVIDASNFQVDGAHWTQTAMDAVWAAVNTKATALGMYSYVAP